MPNPTRADAPITNAMLSAHHLTKHLQRSLEGSNAVTSLVLLPLIARAAALQADISALNATE